jgi:N-acetylglucosaminyldiphosphoundecaprenol N-acetyl-beta-D-mannosaminyltransferase
MFERSSDIAEPFKLAACATDLELSQAVGFLVENSCILKSDNAFSVTAGLHITSLIEAEQINSLVTGSVFVHADGISVTIARRLYTNQKIPKIATTDLLPELIDTLAKVLIRKVNVLIVGGEPGVAELAALALKKSLQVEVIDFEHGYLENYMEFFEKNLSTQPDLVLVGMGMPKELEWAIRYRELLPRSLFVTCGGLLRLLAGEENRSPVIFQRMNLEWLYRLAIDPNRTTRRYLNGSFLMARLLVWRLRK